MTDHCPTCPFKGCETCRYQGDAHFQAVMARQRHERAVLIEPLRVVVDGVTYDCTRPTEHQAGVHRLIRHYRRTDVPVVVGVAS